MSDLFLSRVNLRSDVSVANLTPILYQSVGTHRSEVSRRLVWTLFADHEDRKRDFLWREDVGRGFYLLSNRPPEDRHQLFTVETRAFKPVLSAGDPLVFCLRANATTVRPRGDACRAGKRDDVVMAALHELPKNGRVGAREKIIQDEGLAWLRRQAAAAGFDFNDVEVAVRSYQPLTIRGCGSDAVRISAMEFEGRLTIREPDIFLKKMARGFGRGKAFGLGLLLVSRPASRNASLGARIDHPRV